MSSSSFLHQLWITHLLHTSERRELNEKTSVLLLHARDRLLRKHEGSSLVFMKGPSLIQTWCRSFSALFANEIKNIFQRLKRSLSCEICGTHTQLYTCHRRGASRSELCKRAMVETLTRHKDGFMIDVRTLIRAFFRYHMEPNALFFLCGTHHKLYDRPLRST